jgi:hypothetical protein
MTTFTMQDLNQMPVTKEEEEAMDALSRLATGRPLLDITPTTQDVLNNLAIPQPTPPSPEPDINTIINTICAQLQLLTSVISKNQGNSHGGEAGEKSLQECVSATLEQAEWFKEMVDKQVEELVDDKDFAYEINSEVEDWFSNSFSFDDYVDIEAEVESKVEEMLDRMVDERLAELVEEKLRSASIRINF